MKSKKRAIIYHRTGANPNDRIVYNQGDKHTILVGVADDKDVIALVNQLVDEGVEIIELCGGLGVVWQAKVIEATQGKVAVGAVLFGIESLISAADFNARYNRGEGPFIEAFIIVHEGTNPDNRTIISDNVGHTSFIPVPDEATAEKVAKELAKSNTQLIELYGDISPARAAKVIHATGNGKIAIGVNAFTLK